MDEYYNIEITTSDNHPSLLDEIKSLTEIKKPKEKKDYYDSEPMSNSMSEPVMLMDTAGNNSEKKKPKKKKKKSVLLGAFDTDEDELEETHEDEENTLIDVDTFLMELDTDVDDDESIIKEQKKGYKKLKKNENEYKKEFAEELTLLYNLLDETSKFGKDLEKDLALIKGNKTRGISKYTNDLTELILTSKQNKLSILKEITGIKKSIADLKIKSDGKNKDRDGSESNPEHLASAYFKNILNHGRSNFINNISSSPNSFTDTEDNDEYGNLIEKMEMARKQNEQSDEDKYNQFMIDRLNTMQNPYRSEEGTKYIEYENYGVKLFVRKCIDTGEWEFIAIDKNGRQIYDYPLPSKRDAGRMKFSDDGSYATDSKGRIYNVKEYYLPEQE